MQIGEVIKTYRKERKLTQEEMANRLGVTAPAVNKWENGNSMPDITLLAPIARLLDITIDELLSFREELTQEEITALVYKVDEMLKVQPYKEVFAWMQKTISQYPNCLQLIWQMATLFDAQRLVHEIPDSESYDAPILEYYNRVLASPEEMLRTRAADSLFHYYMRKGAHEEAETYLSYFSLQNPERKRKQAMLYEKMGRREEAYREYEEILMTHYNTCSMVLNGLYQLALGESDKERAAYYVGKQQEMAKLFEMGRYYEVSPGLELAVLEQKEEEILVIVSEMLGSVKDMITFIHAPLYEHVKKKEVSETFLEEMRESLLNTFRNEPAYGFMKDNMEWRKMIG